ncbi:MAG: hypothetical protein M0Z53_05480, partial [Thermaerobacter sp.]|nr:hypothetical protein [Thermaerobacter sp.]
VQEIVRRGFFRQTTRAAIGVLVSDWLAGQVGRRAFDPQTLFEAGNFRSVLERLPDALVRKTITT